jgi:phage terminase large subunit-like protein
VEGEGRMTPDAITRSWIKTAADEKAALLGHRFDGERGEFACAWMEKYLCLYEGEYAGEPMILLPCWREFFMRLYGWVRWSDEWKQWIRRFTHASFWGAKKNAKSPNCAAHNLYLLCGDGEKGQKVYQGAANGEQAKIAQMHAVNMVYQSPALMADCRVNKTTFHITHLPSKSTLTILSGDDSRGAKSKEGLNGSVSYDEMHVVNREMEERTSRAGISRKEPINAAFSTAGDDPSSVGCQRFQYGKQVNAGDRDDPFFLHVEYSAPEKLTEAEIDSNLEEYGRAANPAWNYIVKPSEFRADWNRSKGNPRDVARFKQYRLNLWVGSTNPWLDVAGWEKGKREFVLADLAHRDCYLGLDMSRTRDMTSAVLLFPMLEDGGVLRVWPLFWLPEKTAKDRDHLFPFKSWATGNALSLTSGDVVDYKVVEDEIVETVEAHALRVQGLYFDQHYAEEITQRLSDRLGCVRTAVAQSLMTLSPLAKELERRISTGLVHHANNAVLSWQVGHVEVWSDRNQNIRPVKPVSATGKSIDGIMALLDAMAGVVSQAGPSVYETRGLDSVGEAESEAKPVPVSTPSPSMATDRFGSWTPPDDPWGDDD